MSRPALPLSRRVTAVTAATAVLTPTVLAASMGVAGAAGRAADDAYTYTGNPGDVTLNVLSNDSVHASAIIIDINTNGLQGDTELSGNKKSIVYSPPSNFFGTTSFKYTVEDKDGTRHTSNVTITINKTTSSDNRTGTVQSGASTTLSFSGARNNTLQITAAPPSGSGTATVSGAGGKNIVYSAPAGYPGGAVSFSYRYETNTQIVTGTATITVTPAPKQSVSENRSGSVQVGSSTVFDFGPDAAANLSVTSGPSRGTTQVSGGSITYSVAGGGAGSTSFSYRFETATKIQTGTVSVSITAAPKQVLSEDRSGVVESGESITFDFDDDAAGALEVTQGPSRGSTSVSGDDITYSVPDGPAGEVTFGYRFETSNRIQTGKVTVTITQTPGKPAVSEERSASVAEGEADVFTFPDALPGSVEVLSPPTLGSAAAAGSAITYTAPDKVSGDTFFTYRYESSESVISGTYRIDVTPRGVDDAGTAPARDTTFFDVLENDEGTLDASTLELLPGKTGPGSFFVRDGRIGYQPGTVPTGSVATVPYRAADSSGTTFTATLRVTVTANPGVVNYITVSGDAFSGLESPVYYFNSRSSFESARVVAPPAFGSVEKVDRNGADLRYVYTSNSDYSGPDSFTFADGRDLITVNIDVDPLGFLDDFLLERSTSVDLPVLNNDNGNIPPATANLQVISPPSFGTTLTPSQDPTVPAGHIRYIAGDPDDNQTEFVYQAQDALGQTYTQRVYITLTPDVTFDDRSEVVASGSSVETLLPTFAGIEGKGEFQSARITSGPDSSSGGEVTVSGSKLTYSASGEYSGPDSYTYEAKYVYANSAVLLVRGTVSLDVNPVGVADSYTVTENGSVFTPVLDNDLGSVYHYNGTPADDRVKVVSGPSHGSISYTGFMGFLKEEPTYTPNPDYVGEDSFTYTYLDSSDQPYGPVTVNITVENDPENDAPPAVANTDELFLAVGETKTIDVDENDENVDPSEMTIEEDPEHLSVEIGEDGVLTVTSVDTYSGYDSFQYGIRGDDGTYAQATVDVYIAPVAAPDATTTPEDRELTIDVEANDTGSTGDTTPTIQVQAEHGVASLTTDGKIQYIPAGDGATEDFFTYTLVQTAQDEVVESNEVRVDITILLVDERNYEENLPAGGSATTDFNQDGNPVVPGTLEVVDGPNSGTLEIDDETGEITYTPATGFSGPDSYTYRVQNDSGIFEGVVDLDVDPVGVDDAAETRTDTAVTFEILENDLGSIDRSPLFSNPSLVEGEGPENGTVTFFKGEPTYTPAEGFEGVDTFAYSYRDSNGQPYTAAVTVTVGDDADDDAATFEAGTVETVDVLANDGPGQDPASVTVIEEPTSGGAVVNEDGTITYTPAENFSGIDTLRYEVFDADEQRSVATVTFTVTPVAVDDTLVVREDTAGTVDVLKNDRGSVDSIRLLDDGTNGTAVIVLGDTGPYVLYTPNRGYSGPDEVVYEFTDEAGQSVTGTVTITVSPLFVPPVDPTDPTDPVEPAPVDPTAPAPLTPIVIGDPDPEKPVTPVKPVARPADDLAYTGTPVGLLAVVGSILTATGAAVAGTFRRRRGSN